MKKIMYLSLLLFVPYFLSAGHGRDRLNGKWVNTVFNQTIKIKVKRDYIKVKGLSHHHRHWVEFTPIGRSTFEDCDGNTIHIKSIHDIVYTNRRYHERTRFTKKNHHHHGHFCGSGCRIENDYFNYNSCEVYSNNTFYGNNEHYNNYNYDGYNNGHYDEYTIEDTYKTRRPKNNRFNKYSNPLSGTYYVREIDEYVTLKISNRGLKAKRANGNWVYYNQNRYRKNEYLDKNGNKYLILNNGNIKWKSQDESISLNLSNVISK
ncbi:MAG: hypothetical protein V3V14_14125 [Saprospiraceae bacterium]